jgi:hypothetical protein
MAGRENVEQEVVQYEVEARLVLRARVTVEAASAEEARAKFDAMNWIDNGFDAAEVSDWEATGTPRRTG